MAASHVQQDLRTVSLSFPREGSWALRSTGTATWTVGSIAAAQNTPSVALMTRPPMSPCTLATTSGNSAQKPPGPAELHLQQ